jgi:hypothetical protein
MMYLYLMSNDRSVAGNQTSSFRTVLAETLRFSSPHEVALVSIQFEKTWSTIRRSAPANIWVNESVKISIPADFYELPALVKALNTAIVNKGVRSVRRRPRQIEYPDVDNAEQPIVNQEEELEDVNEIAEAEIAEAEIAEPESDETQVEGESETESVDEIKEAQVVIDIDRENEFPVPKKQYKVAVVSEPEPEDPTGEDADEILENIDEIGEASKRVGLTIDMEEEFIAAKNVKVDSPPVSLPPSDEELEEYENVDEIEEPEPIIRGLAQKLQFMYDEEEKKVQIKILSKEIATVRLSWNLQYVLGFSKEILTETQYATQTSDEKAGLSSLYVYTNIIKSQFIGSEMAKVLYICDVGNDKFGSIVVRNYSEPHYLPLDVSEISEIKIDIASDDGALIPFKYGKVLIKLHIRPSESAQW